MMMRPAHDERFRGAGSELLVPLPGVISELRPQRIAALGDVGWRLRLGWECHDGHRQQVAVVRDTEQRSALPCSPEHEEVNQVTQPLVDVATGPDDKAHHRIVVKGIAQDRDDLGRARWGKTLDCPAHGSRFLIRQTFTAGRSRTTAVGS